MAEPRENDVLEPLDGAPYDAAEDDGVDLTLIRWWLSMTPAERLATLQANANALQRLRDVARFEE